MQVRRDVSTRGSPPVEGNCVATAKHLGPWEHDGQGLDALVSMRAKDRPMARRLL